MSIAGLTAPHGFSTRSCGSLRDPAAKAAFLRGFGLGPDGVAEIRAVHGAAVARANGPGAHADTDALITDQPGLGLLIAVGDCHPILLHDPRRGAVGIVHAGRRGTAAGVTARTLEAMAYEYGTRPEEVIAGVGPGICAACYETDVRGDNLRQLREAGVPDGQVHVLDLCTKESPDLFSHRGGDAGRFGALITLP